MIELDESITVWGALERADLETARAGGVTLVVDLREDTEPVPHGLAPSAEAACAGVLGLSHRRVPIGPEGPFRRPFAVVDALVHATCGRVLLHCASGRRAAAAAVAALGRARGWTPAECTRTLRRLGFEVGSMPPLGRAVAEYVARGPADGHVAGGGLGI